MIPYSPGDTLAHRLDPRSKLGFQFGFAIAAVAHATLLGLAASFVIALCALAVARLSPLRALRDYRVVLAVLALGPLLGGLSLTDPWFRVEPALASLRSVLRIVPILLVSAAVVHTTTTREVRAAVQRTIPGRFGRLLGVAIGLTIRLVPVVRGDVTTIRSALAARGGEVRPFYERAGRVAALSVRRALSRADALSLALRARCFAYNPTLPAVHLERIDWLVLGLAALLALSPVLR